jgi:DHA2 family multidrug resistance protein
MAEVAEAAPVRPAERADLTAWIAVIAASLGSFMATLDISIVNASLPTIQGEIGASGTEATWVGTSYLVAESIAIPLAAWLTRLMGLRRLMLAAIILFTAFSVMCGLAHNLLAMIIGRSAQGLTGGLMMPTAMTIIIDRMPRAQQPIGFAVFAFTTITGPLIGPALGGWMTENVSWHYGFFINVPIGFVLLGLLAIGLPRQAGRLEGLREADWLGVAGMAIGLGCLTVVLEEGQRELWFESREIVWLSIASAFGFVLLAIGQFVARSPVLRLGLLRDWRFAVTIVLTATVGMSFYCTSFIVPQFLASIANYNSYHSGLVLLVGGLPPMFMVPFGPFLIRTLDTRFAVGLGIVLMALASWLDSSVSPEAGAAAFILTQLIRGAGICLTITFLAQLSLMIAPPEYVADASGLTNAFRNLGGSFALAGVATIQDQRFWLHNRRLEETVAANSGGVHDFLDGLAQLAGGAAEGLRLFAAMIERQALVMTFNDLFWLLATATIAVLPFALLLPQFPNTDELQPVH